MTSAHPLSRRSLLALSAAGAASVALTACSTSRQGTTSTSGAGVATQTTAAEKPVASPAEALERLLEGNRRFAAGQPTDLNEGMSRRAQLAKGQQPFATVFSCVDSRVPPELVFDRGLGDLFVIRTAGHVIDDASVGSMQFGVAELKVPLVVVMGHEKCGAVKAALEAVESGAKAPDKVNSLVEGIAPAIEHAKGQPGDPLDNAVRSNVALAVRTLSAAPLVAEAISEGRLKVVGARYDLDTGTVALIA